jgi:adenosylcobinamide-GDP ribazoletransferase
VLAVVFVVLLDVAALTALPGGSWAPVAALAVAAATGRVAVLVGAHRAIPAAHTGGFGAFVAGSVPGWLIAVQTGLMLAGAGALGAAVSADLVAWVAAPAAALLFAGGFLLHARRRLGGVTGDVFGALVELGTAAALVGLAFS